MTCLAVGLNSHRITLLATLEDGSWRQFCNIAHQRRLIRLQHQVLGCSYDTVSTDVCFQTAAITTTALASSVNETAVSELTGISFCSYVLTALREDTATYTYTQTDNHKVLQSVGRTVGIFSQCRHVGVISYGNSHSHAVAHQCCQGNLTLPGQVGSIADTPCYRTATGCTDSYRTNLLIPSVVLHQHIEAVRKFCHILVYILIVGSHKIVFCQNVSADIDDGERRTLNTDVDSNDLAF